MLVSPGFGRLEVRDEAEVLDGFGGCSGACFGASALVWVDSGVQVWWLGLGAWVERLAGLAWDAFRSAA
jgi:hypothetical protein